MQATTDHLGRKATGATAKFALFLAVLIFLAAGTPSYWQGWLFLANFCGWSAATTAYFLKRDPALVERRLHAGPVAEREPAQKRIQLFMSVVMIALFIGWAVFKKIGSSFGEASGTGAKLMLLAMAAGLVASIATIVKPDRGV